MQTQEQILLFTIDQLEALRIPYFLIGSVAVGVYGKPRFTHDIELVVSILPTHIPQLLGRFDKEFYISEDGLHDALQHYSMANLIHHASGLKVDLWIAGPHNNYVQTQFSRKTEKKAFGRKIYLISPEDIILQKFVWFKETTAERDWTDALGVWEFLGDTLDRSYMEQWAERLSVTASWKKLIAQTS